ncbi:EAL domain-containing protein [Marinomonas sp. 15G1-11]|uniref:EAL domain-containing protein n=1 Tax=Marinomonas phaeophyticola TaxID=3004091 RepID=A0ABT4JPJ1_9GAMM|nr:EAL domain-containing protein [Marinomonas sp. 15G1-11]MCZ2720297.1 EAL domain-containing protein [Marinomonas sp. 15G1-11]
MDVVEFYEVSNNMLVNQVITGDTLPFSTRFIKNNTFTFPLSNKNTDSELYVKVYSEGILKLPFNLYTLNQVSEKIKKDSILIGTYVGFMIFAIIGCLIVLGITKNDNFIYFSLYFFILLINGLNFKGMLFQWVWPSHPEFNKYTTNIICFVLAYSQLLFVEKYLRIVNVWQSNFLYYLKLISLSALCFSFAPGLYSLVSVFGIFFIVLVTFLCWFLSVYYYLKKTGDRQKELYFVLAWLSYGVGLASVILDSTGILPILNNTAMYVVLAYSMQVVFLVATIVDNYEKSRKNGIKEARNSVRELEQRQIIERHMLFKATHDSISLLPKKQVLLQNWTVIKEYIPTNRSVNVVIVHFEGYYSVVLAYGQEVADILVSNLHERIKKEVMHNKQFSIVDYDWNNDKVVVLDSLDVCLVYVAQEGEEVAENLLHLHKKVSKPFSYQDVHLDVEITLGVSELAGSEHISSAVRKAQVASKESCHRKIALLEYQHTLGHDPEYTNILLSKFKKALENDGLNLAYQPQINTTNGVLYGVEALLRWSDDEEGIMSPDIFIPIIEQSSLINDLTKFVIKNAFQFYKNHVELFKEEIQLSINLSARNFLDRNLMKYVSHYLIEYDVEPKNITFELTETVFLGDLETSKKIFNKLLDLGVNIALDDFGTGYSSLVYLRELPFAELKIDKGFLVKDFHTKQGAGLVRAAIDLGNSLDMLVVAEGVESLALAKQLKLYGCTLCQGYYFAKPMRESDFIEWYRTYDASKNVLEG